MHVLVEVHERQRRQLCGRTAGVSARYLLVDPIVRRVVVHVQPALSGAVVCVDVCGCDDPVPAELRETHDQWVPAASCVCRVLNTHQRFAASSSTVVPGFYNFCVQAWFLNQTVYNVSVILQYKHTICHRRCNAVGQWHGF